MKLRKRIASISIAAILMLSSVSVFAQYQSASGTHDGRTYNCALDCTFETAGTDKASASTTWSLYARHQVGIALYQCQNAFADYQKIDEAKRDTAASVSGGVIGVWKFKSHHYIWDLDLKQEVTNLEMVDW